MLDATKVIPIIGIKSELEENMLILPIKPPNESEPVSPIKTLALLTLNTKNPINAPIREQHNSTKFTYSSFKFTMLVNKDVCKQIKIAIKIKYTKETLEASPSKPSVKLTLLVIEIKIIATIGIVKTPKSITLLEKGK